MAQPTQTLLLESVRLKQASLILRAVNHPLRFSVLKLLQKHGTLDVTTLYRKLKQGQSVTSQHLGILRKAGAVITTRDGQRIFYSVNNTRIAQLQKAVEMLVP